MNKQEFLDAMQDMLQCDDPLSEDTALTDLEEWDSLSFMAVIAFFNKNLKQRILFDELKNCRTPADIIGLSKGAIN